MSKQQHGSGAAHGEEVPWCVRIMEGVKRVIPNAGFEFEIFALSRFMVSLASQVSKMQVSIGDGLSLESSVAELASFENQDKRVGVFIALPSGPGMTLLHIATVQKMPDGSARSLRTKAVADTAELAALCLTFPNSGREIFVGFSAFLNRSSSKRMSEAAAISNLWREANAILNPVVLPAQA